MSLEHAVLGFLGYQPMSGYDLKKFFDQSVGHFWSATQSHIYKTLEKLEENGLVESRLIPQEGKPNRKEYQITAAGRAELQQWLTTPLPLGPVREPWMIQLFFAHPLSNEQIAHLLESRRDAIHKVMDELLQTQIEINQEKREGPPGIERMSALWQTTLDYGIDFYKAELTWLEKTLERVNHLPALPRVEKP